MKKLFILVLVVVMLGTSVYAQDTQADEAAYVQGAHVGSIDAEKTVENERVGNSKKAKNVVKLELLFPIGLAYERVITNRMSLSIMPYVSIWFISFSAGGALTPRFYLSKTKNVPSGWFVGAPVSVYYTSLVTTDFTSSGIGVAVAVGPGYQWIMPSGFTVDLFAALGLGYEAILASSSGEESGGTPILEFGEQGSNDGASGGIIPNIHFNLGLGYAF